MRASLVIVFGLIASAGSSAAADNLIREVRHELLLVPGYTAFDWLAYRTDGAKVTLLGAVVHGDLKRDAENAVKKIEGVGSVQNDIEVLPESASDDRVRYAILQSINQQMSVYLVEEVKRIHIIVKNGNVTLEGEVSSQADKERASVLAKHVQRVSDVTNNLVIQK
jgi:hyperosmotically inducible protein